MPPYFNSYNYNPYQSNVLNTPNQSQMNSYGSMNQPQNSSGIIWVQGMEEAKAYQIPSGTNAMLLDSKNEGYMYIKTCDNTGMHLRTFKYEEVTNDIDMSQYVKRSELDEFILAKLEEFTIVVQMTKNDVLQPQALTDNTSTAVDDIESLSFVTLVQVSENNSCKCCDSPTVIRFVNTGIPATFVQANVTVTKIC